MVPSLVSVRHAIVLGFLLHALEYVLYALCDHGAKLVLVLILCCLSGLEPPSMHALIASQV